MSQKQPKFIPVLTQAKSANGPSCTLDAASLDSQLLEWADLGNLALSSERITGGVESTYPIDLAEAVEDLAQRESDCCGSWLTLATERTSDLVRLRVTTENPEGLQIILGMTGHQK